MDQPTSEPGTRPPGNRGKPTIPRWAKAIGILTVLALALYLATTLLGGGHGPGRHTPDAPPTDQRRPATE